MDKRTNIYKQVKSEADVKFQNNGIYKSAWIVNQYKRRGGRFNGKKPDNKQGLQRWFNEDWVRVDSKGRPTNKPCGRSNREMASNVRKGLCRPVKRITKQTPKTANELGQKKLQSRYRRKRRNPEKRIADIR